MNFVCKDFSFDKPDKTYLIAEVGVNHNRDIAIAKKMVEVAREAKADIIKFQLFDSEKEVSIHADKADYQKKNTSDNEGLNQLEMCKALELSPENIKELKAFCEKLKMPFLCTAFEKYSLNYLVDGLGLKTIKIPSPEITNIPFLRQIGQKKVSVILSTGASHLHEVALAIQTLKEAGCKEIVLLHCVSQYPTPYEDLNLRAMHTMKQAFGLPVGFSDHSLGIEADIAAAALGAVVIEKHFTLDRNMKGPDHKASIEPDELRALVKGLTIANKALGSYIKQPATCEQGNLSLIRKSLVAGIEIEKGKRLEENMIEIKRPMGGVSPADLDKIIGLRVNRTIQADELIHWEDLA
ncbi:N-acetylneuraminate synthase [Candidatus Beckwithbacteria bacterium CG23_combo_of_CG06-09_8_20_14_all_34_8]|uniref:N-acetylneuraminate synthase n=1 Tax=Candidatus Beckwithbacteria bacterium CG23_combo_of_CG06-09_8_20_14_all_34_8 TaxID=1974497 RepID=A0A2H0B603_9BACT|nr:MAG: N-acetylneuraminate synthase [Candidatus Beckwithbacteria bacterium CG23_combo_of_CG06-09_8_20_14_all_34_8]